MIHLYFENDVDCGHLYVHNDGETELYACNKAYNHLRNAMSGDLVETRTSDMAIFGQMLRAIEYLVKEQGRRLWFEASNGLLTKDARRWKAYCRLAARAGLKVEAGSHVIVVTG